MALNDDTACAPPGRQLPPPLLRRIGPDPSSRIEFYPDADADGYGTTTGSVAACSAPDGYTDQAGDCDDDDPELNPETRTWCSRTGLSTATGTGTATPPRW